MSYCKRIEEYRGNKSQKIINMINTKLKQKGLEQIPKLVKNKELNKARNNFLKLTVELKKAKDQHDKIANKLSLSIDEYRLRRPDEYKLEDQYHIKCDCGLTGNALEELQTASNRWALGNKEGAIKIWDKYIKKYNLFGDKK